MLQQLQDELAALGSSEKADHLSRFFKTGPGDYGEGDVFMGVTVPELRKLAKAFASLEDKHLHMLMTSEIHEHRLISLFFLVKRYQTSEIKEQTRYYQFYLDHFENVNNWDLVDQSAHHIVGHYLFEKDRSPLKQWVKSPHLWTRRIAIVATWHFIRQNDFADTYLLAEHCLTDKEDLMHKAVGWMLREAGKRDQEHLEGFLKKHYQNMPRTMLRYAIERFDEPLRQAYLKATI